MKNNWDKYFDQYTDMVFKAYRKGIEDGKNDCKEMIKKIEDKNTVDYMISPSNFMDDIFEMVKKL